MTAIETGRPTGEQTGRPGEAVDDGASRAVVPTSSIGHRGGPDSPYDSQLITHYARDLGLPVIPLADGNRPTIKDWPNQATTDPETIRDWFKDWGYGPRFRTGVGILTGKRSRLVVVDIDSHDPACKVDPWDFPYTLTVITHSGGWHLYCRYPDGIEHIPKVGRILPGVDLLADKAFAIAPPSIRTDKTGRRYHWYPADNPWPDWESIAPLPEWLLELALARPVAKAEPKPRSLQVVGCQRQTAKPDWSGIETSRDVGIVRVVLESEVGERNSRLNWSAYHGGINVSAGRIDEGQIRSALLAAALEVGLDESEAERTIRSGMRAGATQMCVDSSDAPQSDVECASYDKSGEFHIAWENGQVPAEESKGEAEADRSVVQSAPALKTEEQGGQKTPSNSPGVKSPLKFYTIAELVVRVDAAGPRRFLLRGIWPAGDYGVHAAEPKAGKTWNTVDLAVAVASGTPWLDHVAVDQSGPVLMFAGEGGEGNIVRRIRAIAEPRGLTAEALPITICTRAPHLSAQDHRVAFECKVRELQPVLVTIDPFYLAARGAQPSDLYAMGEMLEGAQHICQQAGAALLVVTHFNRKQGSGAARITGAGPAEWGRVLISAEVRERHNDPATRTTEVITDLDVIGGEVPDRTLKVRRKVWADRPEDLDSPLHVTTTVTECSDDGAEPGGKRKPAEDKVLLTLRSMDQPGTVAEVINRVGLSRQTVSGALNQLQRNGLAESTGGKGAAKLWRRS